MESKKRPRSETSPQYGLEASPPASPSATKQMTLAGHPKTSDMLLERPTKKPKLAEKSGDATTDLLDLAIASLVVEPCDSTSNLEPSINRVSLAQMSGREAECALIEGHFKEVFESGQPKPLYVCGTPGSGKTACISATMARASMIASSSGAKANLAPYSVKINCATDTLGTSSSAIYSVLLERIIEGFDSSEVSTQLDVKLRNSKPPKMTDQEFLPILLKAINEYHAKFARASADLPKPLLIFVLLDEIDHLLITKTTLNTELHFLFSSWKEVWGILSIVAISNTHDLFERYLPLLSVSASSTASKSPGAVTIVQFAPYTSDQLSVVLDARLKSRATMVVDSATTEAHVTQPSAAALFDSKTILFLTAKIAKLPGDQAGDARILIDLAKTSLIEARKTKKIPVTLDVAAKVWRMKMTAPAVDPVSQLTLTQKSALVCLIIATNGLNVSATSVRPTVLETTWKQILPKIFYAPSPPLSELYAAISLLEGIGHVRILEEKGKRKSYQLVSQGTLSESLRKDLLFKELL